MKFKKIKWGESIAESTVQALRDLGWKDPNQISDEIDRLNTENKKLRAENSRLREANNLMGMELDEVELKNHYFGTQRQGEE